MLREEVEAMIRLLQSRMDTDISVTFMPREAKLLLDYINQLRIMATRLHEAGMAAVRKAFEYGPYLASAQRHRDEEEIVAAHAVAAPIVAVIGTPSSWVAQAVSALTRHVEAGG